MYRMQPKLLLLLVISASLGYTAAHKVGFGSCPRNMQVADKLDLNKFAGKWNVLMVAKAYSKCLTMTFTVVNDKTLKITEAREFGFLETVNMEHTNKYTGELTIPNSNEPAKMNIKWPGNFAPALFYVMEVDPENNYALLFECQQWLFVHRTSAAILARGKSLDSETMNMLMSKLGSVDISSEDMTPIDHEQCLSDGEGAFNTNIDLDTFGGDGNILNLIPEIALATRDKEVQPMENVDSEQ
ncbi:apolipoprotein D-like [Oratosquilla oratoria]|uniref:apolipoprotein D-like n=1 Tax=Oratosquilla oratoria TaxID=337810 RepID=UPI003F777F82